MCCPLHVIVYCSIDVVFLCVLFVLFVLFFWLSFHSQYSSSHYYIEFCESSTYVLFVDLRLFLLRVPLLILIWHSYLYYYHSFRHFFFVLLFQPIWLNLFFLAAILMGLFVAFLLWFLCTYFVPSVWTKSHVSDCCHGYASLFFLTFFQVSFLSVFSSLIHLNLLAASTCALWEVLRHIG